MLHAAVPRTRPLSREQRQERVPGEGTPGTLVPPVLGYPGYMTSDLGYLVPRSSVILTSDLGTRYTVSPKLKSQITSI